MTTPLTGDPSNIPLNGTPNDASDDPLTVRQWTAPARPAAPLEDPQEAAKWMRFRLRHFTPSGCGVDATVAGNASNTAITFKRAESNTKYGVHVIPSWNTTVYLASGDKLTTGFTVHYGSNAPGGGGTISWATFRSED